MRVVAGSARGRALVAPHGNETRPTSDKVRQALFNSLESYGLIAGARVVDLFAGSGALGIEALSRGASSCTFVERARPAVTAIRHNLRSTGLADHATVVVEEVGRWLAAHASDAPFDLALADPPYAFDGWDELLRQVPAEVVVAESDREVAPPPGVGVIRVKQYGGTVVTFLTTRTDP